MQVRLSQNSRNCTFATAITSTRRCKRISISLASLLAVGAVSTIVASESALAREDVSTRCAVLLAAMGPSHQEMEASENSTGTANGVLNMFRYIHLRGNDRNAANVRVMEARSSDGQGTKDLVSQRVSAILSDIANPAGTSLVEDNIDSAEGQAVRLPVVTHVYGSVIGERAELARQDVAAEIARRRDVVAKAESYKAAHVESQVEAQMGPVRRIGIGSLAVLAARAWSAGSSWVQGRGEEDKLQQMLDRGVANSWLYQSYDLRAPGDAVDQIWTAGNLKEGLSGLLLARDSRGKTEEETELVWLRVDELLFLDENAVPKLVTVVRISERNSTYHRRFRTREELEAEEAARAAEQAALEEMKATGLAPVPITEGRGHPLR